MKICNNCKKEYDDNINICPTCNEKLTNIDNKKTIQIEETIINKKAKEKSFSKYYYLGAFILGILGYFSYQINFLLGTLLFSTLAIIVFSKTKEGKDMKAKPLEVILTMPIVLIIIIILFIFTIIFFPLFLVP